MLLSGRVALVTGATSGIGFHTARGLARSGAAVFVTGRNARRGAEAERMLRASAGHEDVHFIQADASTVGANQELAHRVISMTHRLDILVNNVGGTYSDRSVTQDGYELTLAINFIGPFALTQPLLSLLCHSSPARIVNVTSAAIGMLKGDPFADVQSERSYLGSDAYARSKLLNVLWTFALAERLAGTGVTANAVHPGMAWTSMTAATEARAMPAWMTPIWPLIRWLQRRGSAEEAAHAPDRLATAPELEGVSGLYFGSNGRPARAPEIVLDPFAQEHACALGRELVNEAPSALHGSGMLA